MNNYTWKKMNHAEWLFKEKSLFLQRLWVKTAVFISHCYSNETKYFEVVVEVEVGGHVFHG